MKKAIYFAVLALTITNLASCKQPLLMKESGSISLSTDFLGQMEKSLALTGDELFRYEQAFRAIIAEVKVSLYRIDSNQSEGEPAYEFDRLAGDDLSFGHIRPGQYLLRVVLNDADDQELFSGESPVTVVANENTEVSVKMIINDSWLFKFNVDGLPGAGLSADDSVVITASGETFLGRIDEAGRINCRLPLDFKGGNLEICSNAGCINAAIQITVFDCLAGITTIPYRASRLPGIVSVEQEFEMDFVPTNNPATLANVAAADNYIQDMALDGQMLYTCSGNGVSAFDVHDPSQPIKIASVVNPYGYYGGEWHVGPNGVLSDDVKLSIEGARLYVANYGNSIRILDISNASQGMPKLGEYIDGKYIRKMVVDDSYIYAFAWNLPNNDLRIIDAYDPTDMWLLSALPIGQSFDLVKYGHYLYLASGTNGLSVIDVSDPASPSLVCSVATPWAYKVALGQDVLYLACGGNAMIKAFDISSPASPIELASYSMIPNSQMSYLDSMAVQGNYLYYVLPGAMHTLNLTDVRQGSISVVEYWLDAGNQSLKTIMVSGRRLYGVDVVGRLRIFDLTQEAS